MRTLELKIPPPIVVAVLAAAMYGVHWLAPQWVWPIPLNGILAGIWLATGALLALLGIKAFKEHGTTVNPLQPERSTHIVSTGIYAHTRNPMYLGLVCCLIGWSLWLAHPLAMLAVPLAIVWLHFFQIKPEERILLQKFGEPYAEYLRRVRRWC